MTELVPIHYSEKNNSTFFDVVGLLITVDYTVLRRTRLMVLPGAMIARVQAKIGGGASAIAHEYEIPRNLRVGPEIGQVERGLYGFMDEVVRTAVQKKALESAEKDVEAAEAEHLFFEGELRPAVARAESSERIGRQASEQARLLDELVERVITAVKHLTNVTSLTRDGLEAYQRDRSNAIQKVTGPRIPTAALRGQDVLLGVEAFLRYEAEGTKDVKALTERTLDYLDRVERQHEGPGPAVTKRQAYVIVEEYVPAFVQIKKSYDSAVAYPKDIAGHAFGSFFGGGITGWICISLLGEPVLRGLTGMYVDLPGFYIGAAVAFAWPYLRAIYGAFTREDLYEKRLQSLLRKTGRRLELAEPKD